MVNALFELYNFIFSVISDFLDIISENYFLNEHWPSIMITPGFGGVTWFSISIHDLIGIILYILIVIALMRYSIKFVKWIWSFASRLFGGR